MNAYAQTLQAAPVPTDWTGILWILAIVAIVAAGVYLHRRFPTQSAKADADLKAAGVKALQEISVKLDKALGKADAAAPAEPAAPAPVAGKSGQAGTFSVQVTGDPATDLAAITAAYYAK
jgi:predicted lipid-binding transport protein (Tim44 family)